MRALRALKVEYIIWAIANVDACGAQMFALRFLAVCSACTHVCGHVADAAVNPKSAIGAHCSSYERGLITQVHPTAAQKPVMVYGN